MSTDEHVAQLVARLVGELGLVAHDPSTGVITVVATRIPAPPMVIRCFPDGWATLSTGAGTVEQFGPNAVETGVPAMVRAVLDGRWRESVVRNQQDEHLVQAAWSSPGGDWAATPAAGTTLVTIAYPPWAGPETRPDILPG